METTAPDCAAYLNRALAVGAILVERLLDIPTTPDPEAVRPRNPAEDYQKLTYSMRQTVLLLQGNASQSRRVLARKQIIRAVEDAIHLHAAPRADRLVVELRERLADPAFDAEIDARPTPDLIAELCRDLHAMPKFETHAHQRRTPTEIAALAAQALAPQAPCEPPAKPAPAAAAAEIPEPPEPPRPIRTRRPLSTPSLILPIPHGDPQTPRPEAHTRNQQ